MAAFLHLWRNIKEEDGAWPEIMQIQCWHCILMIPCSIPGWGKYCLGFQILKGRYILCVHHQSVCIQFQFGAIISGHSLKPGMFASNFNLDPFSGHILITCILGERYNYWTILQKKQEIERAGSVPRWNIKCKTLKTCCQNCTSHGYVSNQTRWTYPPKDLYGTCGTHLTEGDSSFLFLSERSCYNLKQRFCFLYILAERADGFDQS